MFFKKHRGKFLLLVIAIVLGVSPLAAQEPEPAGEFPRWYAGISAGYTNNGLYTNEHNRAFTEYERGHGFEVSASGRYRFTEWFALQGEIQFIQKDYVLKRTEQFDRVQSEITNSFINFPIMTQFSFGNQTLRGFLNTGGFIGVWVDSRRKGTALGLLVDPYDPDKVTYYDYDEKVTFDDRRDNLFDAGLLLGAGIQYSFKPVTVFLEGRFNYGLTDLQKDYMYEKVPRINDTFIIQAGILFNRDILRTIKRGK